MVMVLENQSNTQVKIALRLIEQMNQNLMTALHDRIIKFAS